MEFCFFFHTLFISVFCLEILWWNVTADNQLPHAERVTIFFLQYECLMQLSETTTQRSWKAVGDDTYVGSKPTHPQHYQSILAPASHPNNPTSLLHTIVSILKHTHHLAAFTRIKYGEWFPNGNIKTTSHWGISSVSVKCEKTLMNILSLLLTSSVNRLVFAGKELPQDSGHVAIW